MTFDDYEPTLDVGTPYSFDRPAAVLPQMRDEQAIAHVIAMIRDNPEVAQRLARQCGAELFREPDVCPLPTGWHRAEIIVGDNGPLKPGTKPSREPVRYKAVMKFSRYAGETIKTLWNPTVELRGAEAFARKLPDYLSGGKCRTPFSAAQEAFVRDALSYAEENGCLIGIPAFKPRGVGGTHFVPFHVLLVAPDWSGAMLYVRGEAGDQLLMLPPFSTEFADGRDISANNKNGNNFILQSRGLIKGRELTSTYTGQAFWR